VFERIAGEITDGTAHWTGRRESEARYRRIDVQLVALANVELAAT
jgi:hypothetical protein